MPGTHAPSVLSVAHSCTSVISDTSVPSTFENVPVVATETNVIGESGFLQFSTSSVTVTSVSSYPFVTQHLPP